MWQAIKPDTVDSTTHAEDKHSCDVFLEHRSTTVYVCTIIKNVFAGHRTTAPPSAPNPPLLFWLCDPGAAPCKHILFPLAHVRLCHAGAIGMPWGSAEEAVSPPGPSVSFPAGRGHHHRGGASQPVGEPPGAQLPWELPCPLPTPRPPPKAGSLIPALFRALAGPQ